MGTRIANGGGDRRRAGGAGAGLPGTANVAAPGGMIWLSRYSASGAEGYAEDTASDGYGVQGRLTWFGSGGKQDTDKAPGDGTHWRATRLVVGKCFIKDGKSSCSEVFDESLG